MANTLKPRRGTKSKIASLNPLLEEGEICLEFPDTGIGTGIGVIKVGDGVTLYNDLPIFLKFDERNVIEWESVGIPNGIAPLNALGQINIEYIPSSLDNILFYDSSDDFPILGELGKLYIDSSNTENNIYRWSGSAYVLVAKSVQYSLEKEGSSVVLVGSDGSRSSVTNVGGCEVRRTEPTQEELYPGKMWIISN